MTDLLKNADNMLGQTAGDSSSADHRRLESVDRSVHLRLIAAAEQDGQDVNALKLLLCTSNATARLSGGVGIAQRLQDLICKAHTIAPDDLARDLKSWQSLPAWILKDPARLASRIFDPDSPDTEKDIERFLRTTGANPVVQMKRHGLFALLWECPIGDLEAEKFRHLHTYVLLSHMAIMRHELEFEEWWKGKEPERGFFESLYWPGWLVRKFLKFGDPWRSVLRAIPECGKLADVPGELRKLEKRVLELQKSGQLEAVVPSKGRRTATVSDVLIGIAGFVEWGLDPAEHSRRKRNGGPHGGILDVLPTPPPVDGNGPGGEPNADNVEKTNDEELEDVNTIRTIIGDEDDDDDTCVRVRTPIVWHRDQKLFSKLVSAGDHPAEELAREPFDLVDDEFSRGACQAGAIEMENQRLPLSWSDISDYDLARFLNVLQKDERIERQQLFALSNSIVFTGAPRQNVYNLLAGTEGAQFKDAELCLKLYQSKAEWRVPALPLPIRPDNLPPSNLACKCVDVFCLPDVGRAALPIKRLLQRIQTAGSPVHLDIPLRVFGHDLEWYKDQLRYVNEQYKFSRPITFEKLERVLRQTITDVSGSDHVSAGAITAFDDPLAFVPRHYPALPVSDLIKLYAKAVRALSARLNKAGYKHECADIDLEAIVPKDHVGSPLCPTTVAYRDMVRSLKSLLRSYAPELTLIDFVAKHNLYSLYSIVAGFMLACLCRGIRTPYVNSSEIDDVTGCGTFQDKRSKYRNNSRLFLIPPVGRDQMRRYDTHLINLSEDDELKKNKLPRPSRKLPCYFLRNDLSWYEVRPSTISELLDRIFPAPANVGRHFGNAKLRQILDGDHPLLSGEMIDGAMGHFRPGQQIFHPFSTMPPHALLLKLETALALLMTEIEFEPMDFGSRLVK
jgi:hypothetical protein